MSLFNCCQREFASLTCSGIRYMFVRMLCRVEFMFLPMPFCQWTLPRWNIIHWFPLFLPTLRILSIWLPVMFPKLSDSSGPLSPWLSFFCSLIDKNMSQPETIWMGGHPTASLDTSRGSEYTLIRPHSPTVVNTWGSWRLDRNHIQSNQTVLSM